MKDSIGSTSRNYKKCSNTFTHSVLQTSLKKNICKNNRIVFIEVNNSIRIKYLLSFEINCSLKGILNNRSTQHQKPNRYFKK